MQYKNYNRISESYNFSHLAKSRVHLYQEMTYPYYRPLLSLVDVQQNSPLIAIRITQRSEPVGLALTLFHQIVGKGRLLSIFITKEHRGIGLGTELIRLTENELARREGSTLNVIYERGRGDWEIIERLLLKCNFLHFQVRAYIGRTTCETMKTAPWLQKNILPRSFKLSLWKDVKDEEKILIKKSQNQNPWYPHELSPFNDEERIELQNSLALRHDDEIVGWQINHRIDNDTIRYTSMFVKEELQNLGLALPMLFQAVKLQINTEGGGPDKATFMVFAYNETMVRFVKKRFLPYLSSFNESVQAIKEL